MRVRFGFARLFALTASIAILACAPRPAAGREPSWQGLAQSIALQSNADSTAVLVLFDSEVLDSLRWRLPQSFRIVPFRHPDVPFGGPFTPEQLGQMYGDATARLANYPDVWVVGRRSGSPGKPRVARFAEMAASQFRRRVLRDSVRTSMGMVEFGRWIDRRGGAAQRRTTLQGQAYADSVIAAGFPKLIPITRPFAHSQVMVDPDTLSLYVAKLADTSFYSIGGCSEVEIVFWNASERLAQLGPGVVPILVDHIDDPNAFARERVQEALFLATQDEEILARTGGEYLKFNDQPDVSARDIVSAWWTRFGHFWTPADSSR